MHTRKVKAGPPPPAQVVEFTSTALASASVEAVTEVCGGHLAAGFGEDVVDGLGGRASKDFDQDLDDEEGEDEEDFDGFGD